MSRSVLHWAAKAACLAGGIVLTSTELRSAAVSVTIVPGTLTQGTVKSSLTGGTYAVESNKLNDWPLSTGGSTTVFPIALTNGNFNGSSFGGTPNTMVAFGNGGGVTLKFDAPVKPLATQKEFGIFTAQFLATSNGSLFNGNMEAAILVSADGANWRTLSGVPIATPTTYAATSAQLNTPTLAYNFLTLQQAWNAGSGMSAAALSSLAVADFTSPMPNDGLFNGVAIDADRKAIATDALPGSYVAMFGSSGGGNWFDISDSGLSEVNYLRLNGVNVPSTGGIRLDAVFANSAAVPEPSALATVAIAGLLLLWRRRA